MQQHEAKTESGSGTTQGATRVLSTARRCFALVALSMMLVACGSTYRSTQVLGQNDEFVVAVAGKSETYEGLAKRFLQDGQQAWRIKDANNYAKLEGGMVVVVPRSEPNRVGVFSDGYQLVPIISYHRFGKGRGRLSVSSETFERQMAFLERNGFRPIRLQDAASFLRAEKAIPRRSVVLTIDDGYQSVYEIAFPILRKYGYPATVFIYSDYIGKGGLTWRQMKEMEASGLISFQAHSKTHDNLTVRSPSETLQQYQARLRDEVRTPDAVLKKRMGEAVFGYAYPFGATNRMVVDELKKGGYELGATVQRGSNPFFAFPYSLRRTMIYEKDGMEDFEQALKTFESRKLR